MNDHCIKPAWLVLVEAAIAEFEFAVCEFTVFEFAVLEMAAITTAQNIVIDVCRLLTCVVRTDWLNDPMDLLLPC